MSSGKEVAACNPAKARGYCVGVQRDFRECRESAGRESLMPAAFHVSPTPAIYVASHSSVNVVNQLSVNAASPPPSATCSRPLAHCRIKPTGRRSIPLIQFDSFSQKCRSQDHGSSSLVTAKRAIPRSSQPAAAIFDQPLTFFLPCVFSPKWASCFLLKPGGFLIPPCYPMYFFLGGGG